MAYCKKKNDHYGQFDLITISFFLKEGERIKLSVLCVNDREGVNAYKIQSKSH